VARPSSLADASQLPDQFEGSLGGARLSGSYGFLAERKQLRVIRSLDDLTDEELSALVGSDRSDGDETPQIGGHTARA
jgi:hypothetical protein